MSFRPLAVRGACLLLVVVAVCAGCGSSASTFHTAQAKESGRADAGRDRDGDGIIAGDECPLLAGKAAHRGCPTTVFAKLERGRIELPTKLLFSLGGAELIGDSSKVLDQVAELLSNAPELRRLEVQGHTDNRGSNEVNLKLSQDRAKAVLDYLVKTGIAPGRLSAKGYGSTRPILCEPLGCPERCRRIELVVLDPPTRSP